ncbi:MAG: metallophosphoesterase family protein, partial [Shinella sp.]|uniref:metallophosphoesterase family protein n=1 Tax=Shinella sp. TaxID=1870904 RepID=UPI0040352ECE
MTYTFAVGDIHGCIDPLNRLLARIDAYAASGTVVFLGDYIDRGPDSSAVLDRLMAGPSANFRWICLMGNHEDMMCGAYYGRSDRDWWLDNGGLETEMSFGGRVPATCLGWAAKLPLMHVDAHTLFVHAGVSPAFPLDQQGRRDLLWLRFRSDEPEDYWGKHLVHGHTPSKSNPVTVHNRTNIDGACVFGGKLVCAVFDDAIAGGGGGRKEHGRG